MHVARPLLLRRLQAVYRYLPLVERFSADDMEFVHQLRVQCRRAEAALEMFRDWLPKSRFQSWRRRLRRYRRAATTARELDVMLASLGLSDDQTRNVRRGPSAARWTSPQKKISKRSVGENDFISFLRRQRSQAQQELVQTITRESADRYQRELEKLLDSLRWRGTDTEPSWHQVSEVLGRKLIERLLCVANETLARRTKSPERDRFQRMHSMRIAGKRLRYLLDISRRGKGWLPPVKLQQLLKTMQLKLGEINDHVVAANSCRRWRRQISGKQVREYLQKCQAHEQSIAMRLALAFERWWKRQLKTGILSEV